MVGEMHRHQPELVVHTVAIGFDKPKLEQISCIAQPDRRQAVGCAGRCRIRLRARPSGQSRQPARRAERDSAGDRARRAPGRTSLVRRAAGPLSLRRAWGEQRDARQPGALADNQVRRRWSAVRDTRAADAVREAGAGHLRRRGAARACQRAPDRRGRCRHGNAGARRSQRRRAEDAGAVDERAAPLTAPIFTVTPASADAAAKPAPLWVGREAHPEIVLAAGDYNVTAQNGIARQQSKVTIAPATGTSFNSMLQSGSLELSATRGAVAGQGEPVTEGVTFILSQDDPDAPQRAPRGCALGRRRAELHAARRHLLRHGAHAERGGARADRHRRRRLSSSAPCRCRWHTSSSPRRSAGKPAHRGSAVTYRVVRLDGEPREIARTIAKEPEFDLSAGRYRLEAALGASNVIAATEIALAAGQAQKVTLPLEGGSITFKRDAGRRGHGRCLLGGAGRKAAHAYCAAASRSRPPCWLRGATSSAPRHPSSPCAPPSRSRPTSTAPSIFRVSESVLNRSDTRQPHFDQARAACLRRLSRRIIEGMMARPFHKSCRLAVDGRRCSPWRSLRAHRPADGRRTAIPRARNCAAPFRPTPAAMRRRRRNPARRCPPTPPSCRARPPPMRRSATQRRPGQPRRTAHRRRSAHRPRVSCGASSPRRAIRAPTTQTSDDQARSQPNRRPRAGRLHRQRRIRARRHHAQDRRHRRRARRARSSCSMPAASRSRF